MIYLFRNPIVRYSGLATVAVLLIVVAVAPLTSAIIENWSTRDIDLRARLVFESIRDRIIGAKTAASTEEVVSFLERLVQDERLLALALCAPDGTVRYATTEFQVVSCSSVVRTKTDTSAVIWTSGRRTQINAFPIAGGSPLGHVLILHNMQFIGDRARAASMYAILAIVGVAAGIGLLSTAILLALLRNWNRSIRGALITLRSQDQGFLRLADLPITSEIREQLRELQLEHKYVDGGTQAEWSPAALRRLLAEELPNVEVLVVSNREPYIHNRTEGSITLQVPASGLVAALEPVMRACGGTWIAHGSGSADGETVDANDRLRVPPTDPAYTLRRVWISDEEQNRYYYGFANEGLWPLCHIAFVRPMFRELDWITYAAINERFAKAVVEEAKSDNPIVLIQDYHFALLPRMVRMLLPKATILTFWHTPWPNAETFGICPWREQIIDGMLGSTILGFHTQLHCNNFLEAVDRFMESRIDRERATIFLGGHETMVRPYPISIEWPPSALAGLPSTSQCRDVVRKRFGLPDHMRIGVGIERFDYTKGILDRIRAVDDLLTRKPEWRGRFVLIQAAAPTRDKINAYSALQAEAAQLADHVNCRHGRDDYKPIILVVRHHEAAE